MSLNKEQQDAVTYPGEPLLIVAGPGSGKTRVIVERALHLLESGTPASQILCLTFSDKATEEMKERLEQHAPAIDITVSTFHSFARRLLLDHPFESGFSSNNIFKRAMQIVWCIKNKNNFDINPDWLRIKLDETKIYDTMLEAMGHFKVEMIGPDDLQKYIDQNIKASVDEQRTKYLRELNEFNKVYRLYEEHRQSNGLMDFDDMVTKAVELLEGDADIRAEYTDRYRCILVDEFQDNNYSQMRLVSILADSKNITAVGDDDQCIMRFQGAYSGIFDEFKDRYGGKHMEVTRNYRSTKNIVEVASRILDGISDRQPKDLRSEEEQGEPVKVIITETARGQAEFIVKKIRKLKGSKLCRRDGSTSPVSYGDFAVLSKRRTDCQEFTHALQSFGIPATLVGETNILSSKPILDLLAFLRIADSPDTAGIDLFALLRDRGISEHGLAKIANEAHRRSREDRSSRQDYLFEVLGEYDSFDIKQKKEIGEFLDQIKKIIELKANSRVGEMVYDIIMKETDLYKSTIDSDKPRKTRDRRLLGEFYDLAREYGEVFPEGRLGDFVESIRDIRYINTNIEETTVGDSVNVLTMHKSKGKEFPFVFITDLADKRFPGLWKKVRFGVPDDLLRGQKVGDSKARYEDDERRLFYVAMTRAMNELFLMYPQKYQSNINTKKPSKFLEELDYQNGRAIKIVEFEEDEPEELRSEGRYEQIKLELQKEASRAIREMNLNTTIHRIIELARVKYFEENKGAGKFNHKDILDVNIGDIDLDRKLQHHREPLVDKDRLYLSPSSVSVYEDCPLKFKFQKILRVPTRTNQSLNLGAVIHTVVESMAKNELSRDDAVKLAQRELANTLFSDSTYDEAMKRVQKMLDAYMEREEKSHNKFEAAEVEFKIKVGDLSLKGKIDRLEKTPDGRLEIVDFKSGSTSKSKPKAIRDPQLNIYAEAVRSKYGQFPVRATLFYLEQNKTVEYDITEESVELAMQDIRDIADDILQERFKAKPSGSKCERCPYKDICDEKVNVF